MVCKYLLRFDDIAPNMNWEVMFKVKNLFAKYNIKPIIGGIPKNEDKDLKQYPKCSFDFWQEIRQEVSCQKNREIRQYFEDFVQHWNIFYGVFSGLMKNQK